MCLKPRCSTIKKRITACYEPKDTILNEKTEKGELSRTMQWKHDCFLHCRRPGGRCSSSSVLPFTLFKWTSQHTNTLMQDLHFSNMCFFSAIQVHLLICRYFICLSIWRLVCVCGQLGFLLWGGTSYFAVKLRGSFCFLLWRSFVIVQRESQCCLNILRMLQLLFLFSSSVQTHHIVLRHYLNSHAHVTLLLVRVHRSVFWTPPSTEHFSSAVAETVFILTRFMVVLWVSGSGTSQWKLLICMK